MKFLRYIACGLLLLLSVGLFAQDIGMVSYKAQKKDGVHRILHRFGLAHDKCNSLFFYEMNELKKKSYIIRGKSYKLPIYVYTYNGKSIRSSIGIDNYKQAKAIQDFNDALQKSKVKKGNFRKNKVLWVPFHLYHCPLDKHKAHNKKGIYPIFGKKHQKVKHKSKKLKGQVYYLVSGHGGPDPGAIGKQGKEQLCEDEYAYDVTLRLAKNLIAHGATAYIIIRDGDGIRSGAILPCDNDEECWSNKTIPINQRLRLHQRSKMINHLYWYHKSKGIKKQKTIVVHVDSRTTKQRIDVFFYHFPGSKLGAKFAKAMHKTMRAKYAKHRKSGKYTGTVSSRDLHMLREVLPTCVYIELGNIRNKNDQKRFTIESNRQALADWLFEGVLLDK